MGLIKEFRWSLVISFIAAGLAWHWAGWLGLFTFGILIILEISLSFDNAVVNAKVLEKMDPVWQQRFLTWGMLIAVFGMRVVFPLVIVAIAANLAIFDVADMALNDPTTYSSHLMASHIQIAAFGGMFLLMVFLGFFFDKEKDSHWIAVIEKPFVKLGKLESFEIVVALLVLLVSVNLLPDLKEAGAFEAGLWGVITYVLLNSLNSFMESGVDLAGTAARAGIISFLYLEVLDASFSFDGVIGAFAVTQDVIIILLGLGIGALFVRSITISLVKHKTLKTYIYLSHGAHYAIGALATIMIISMHVHVPELITGLIGAAFISLGLWSSMRHKRLIEQG